MRQDATANHPRSREMLGITLETRLNASMSLSQVLERAASQEDKGILFRLDQGMRFISYQTLMKSALRLLSKLVKQPEFRDATALLPIGLSLDEFTVAVWAGFLGGRTVVPLGTPKVYNPGDLDATIFSKICGAYKGLCVITSPQHADRVRMFANDHSVITLELNDLSAHEPVTPYAFEDRPAIMYTTSGSTGSPKGIFHSENSLIIASQSKSLFLGMTPQSYTLNWLPLTHSFGMTCHIRDVYLGCNQIISEPRHIVGQPKEFLELINNHRVNVTLGSSYLFSELISTARNIDLSLFDLSCVKHIVCGAETIQGKMVADLLDALSVCQLKRNVVANLYGTTETLGTSACLDTEHFLAMGILPIGVPYPGVTIRLVNPSDDKVGYLKGEVEVKSPFTTESYLDVNDNCIKKFDNNGWFATGDIGYIRDKNLFLSGRTKEMIHVRGKHFAPQAVELLIEDLAFITHGSTVVFSLSADKQPSESLIVLYVPKLDTGVETPTQIAQISAVVSKFCGIKPSNIIPLCKEDIPKSSLGKISRANLRSQYLAGTLKDNSKGDAPTDVENVDGRGVTTPKPPSSYAFINTKGAYFTRDALVGKLTELWKVLLKIADVKPSDDFFLLGGDSLNALQMLGLSREFGVNVTLDQFYTAPTIETLVSSSYMVYQHHQNIRPPAKADLVPLTPAQCKMLYTYPDVTTISEGMYLELTSSFSRNELDIAVTRLLETHEALRTSFTYNAPYWEQKLAKVSLDTRISVSEITFDDINPDSLNKVFAEVVSSINISKGDLCHFKLIMDNRELVKAVLLVINKLACDYYSMKVLLEDFARLLNDNGSNFMQATSSFSSWSNAQSDLLRTGRLLNKRHFWSERQIVAEEMPQLPSDFEVGSVTYSRPWYVVKQLAKTDDSNLSPQRLEEKLVVAFSLTLSKWLNRDWVEMAVLSHGRNHPFLQEDPTRIIGNLACLSRVVLNTKLHTSTLEKEVRDLILKGRDYELLLWANEILMEKSEYDIRPFHPQAIINILGNRNFLTSPTWPFSAQPMLPLGDERRDVNAPELNLAIYSNRESFEFLWEYQPHLYKEATIEMLHNMFIDFLVPIGL